MSKFPATLSDPATLSGPALAAVRQVVQSVGTALGRAAGVVDREFNLLACSDAVSPLRGTAQLGVRLRQVGGFASLRPVLLPADPTIDAPATVWVPIRLDGRLLGFLWLVHQVASLLRGEMERAGLAAREIANALRHASGDGDSLIKELLGADTRARQRAARRILEVWAKPMSDGSVAVVLFNRAASAATITTSAAEIGLGGSSSYSLRNLWTGATSTTSGSISASLAAHGVVMYRVSRAGTLAAPPAAGTHQVGNMTWLASANGYGPAERNTSNGESAAGDGRTLTINGTTYSTGVGAHADSAVHIYLGRACSQFTAQIGVDDEVSSGSVRFQVYGDGRLLGYTGVKTGSQGPSSLSFSTSGYSTLGLRVTEGRDGTAYDHADWGAAAITCGSAGTVVYRDDFETATGWQANPNGSNTATAGRLERGDPQATTFNGATYQQGTTPSGVYALVTGAAGGDVATNDLDGGTTSIQSPAITLPAGATLSLSFQYYLAHLDDATSSDYLRIRAVHSGESTIVFSRTGGAVNTPATWQTGSADLIPYAGQSIRLVSEAADADTASLVEAAVDGVAISRQ